MKDKRPDPKPRKNKLLWQHYLLFDELRRSRIRHNNRLESARRGKSLYSEDVELAFIETIDLYTIEAAYKKMMIDLAETNNLEIWEWITSIKGLGEGTLAAQLIAQVDDIGRFANISKLWRFAGLAVIDGKAEANKPGEKSHKNKTLRSILYNINDQFIKQQTPGYVDIYYDEKARLRDLHPEKIKVNGKWKYNDGHIHMMARRKMIKIFLSHLWLIWREIEGLPITLPYAIDILKHSEMIEPLTS